ncbi:MAG: glycosyltransferase family 39 protein [Anaerolineae bacterium]|nr:glycosyltransferase family 39 protein [Anaerolineae bacterium]
MNAEKRGLCLHLPLRLLRFNALGLSARVRVLLLLILLLAAGLRFYRLDAQSFWNDEGNAVRAAERPIPLVIAAARGDIHPPGYYLLLHFWRIPTGDSEFAVRALSVYIGLLAVALTGRLGRRMFGAEVGLVAALLAALSPLAVYYSQEARMYGLLGLIAVASTDLLWSFLSRPRLRAGVLYALVAAAGLYTHYSFPFVLLAHNLLVLGWWLWPHLSSILLPSSDLRSGEGRGWRRSRRRWGEALQWLALQASIVLLYLPWLPTALRATGWPSAGRNYTLGAALLDIFRALAVGITLEADQIRPVLYSVGVLLALGLWPLTGALAMVGARCRTSASPTPPVEGPAFGENTPEVWPFSGGQFENIQRSPPAGRKEQKVNIFRAAEPAGGPCSRATDQKAKVEGRGEGSPNTLSALFAAATLALWLLVPLVLIFAFDLYKPAYLKFLLAVLPAFHILLAAGIHNLARAFQSFRLSTLYTLAFYALTLYFLTAQAFLPSLRNLYFNPAYARDNYRGIAADIASAARPGDAILLNAPNQWEVFTYYYKGDLPIYPFIYHPRPEDVGPWLEPILASHQRLFVLYWGDLEADPQRWLENLLADRAYPGPARWYGRVRLALYGVAETPDLADPRVVRPENVQIGPVRLRGYVWGRGPFQPGEVVPVTLFWETEAPLPERHKVFVHLMESGGNLVAQHDSEPRGDLSPTTFWPVGTVVADRHGIFLPPGLPPGTYELRAGLYRLTDGTRLPVIVGGAPAGDFVVLGEVEVK